MLYYEMLHVGFLALDKFVGAGEGALVQPAVGVDGHRLAPELRHVGVDRGFLQKRQQSRYSHDCSKLI